MRSSFSWAFLRRRERVRRPSHPKRVVRRGHSAATRTATAQVSRAIQSQPTTQVYRPLEAPPRSKRCLRSSCRGEIHVKVRPFAIALVATLASLLAGGAGAVESLHARTACPRLGEAPSLPLRPGGSPLQADLDGDGRRDRITIRYAPRARASCGFLLVVRTASRTYAVRVKESYKPPQDMRIRDWPFPEPYLGAGIRLDADRSQVVVARRHGASVTMVSLYGLVDGRLSQLGFHPHGDQLWLFGTAGTGVTNARCGVGGPLTVLHTWPNSANRIRWSLRRTTYRLAGGGLERTRARMVEGARRKVDALAHRWGIDAAPFTGCVVARGRRL